MSYNIPKRSFKDAVEMDDYIRKSNRERGTKFQMSQVDQRASIYLRVKRVFDELPNEFTITDIERKIKVPMSGITGLILISKVLEESFKCVRLKTGFRKP